MNTDRIASFDELRTVQPLDGVRTVQSFDKGKTEQLELACEAFASFGLNLPKEQATDLVDRVHAGIAGGTEPVDLPLNHIFTKATPGACGGMYTREIFMPAGAWVVSHIHRTAHPFVVLSGVVMVWTRERGVETLAGGHLGITAPGTRRILYIVEDTVWATFHATELQDVKAIEGVLLEPHQNPYLEEATTNHE
jgi:hypothetical protein